MSDGEWRLVSWYRVTDQDGRKMSRTLLERLAASSEPSKAGDGKHMLWRASSV